MVLGWQIAVTLKEHLTKMERLKVNRYQISMMDSVMGGSTAWDFVSSPSPRSAASLWIMGKSSHHLEFPCELKLLQGFNRIKDTSEHLLSIYCVLSSSHVLIRSLQHSYEIHAVLIVSITTIHHKTSRRYGTWYILNSLSLGLVNH